MTDRVSIARTFTQLLIVCAWLLVMLGAILTSGVSLQQGDGLFAFPTLTGLGTLPVVVMGGASAVVVVALLVTDRVFV